MTGKPKFCSDRGHARRRLLAVKLEHIGLQRRNDGGQQPVVGVDREGDFLRAAAHAPAEGSGRIERKVPRRRRKEHEPDHVGARVQLLLRAPPGSRGRKSSR